MSLNFGCKNVINQVRVTLEKWLSGFKGSKNVINQVHVILEKWLSGFKKSAANDGHRLKQYLAKYQLEFQQIKAAMMS